MRSKVIKRKSKLLRQDQISYITMLLPSILFLLVFAYIPMAGLIIAFQKFRPSLGLFGNQEWVGLKNFATLFNMPDFMQVVGNTIIISLCKTIFGFLAQVLFAILLSEIEVIGVRKGVQTIACLPHFLSWVVVASMFTTVLSPEGGLINTILGTKIYFLGEPSLFRGTVVFTDIWKEFGYGSIIYLTGIIGINPTLFEAAKIDGANKFQQIIYITLPGISGIMVLMLMLGLSNILNAGFDQLFNMLNSQVYSTGDTLDTYIYRMAFGVRVARYDISAAAGFLKSILSFLLVSGGYYLAYKLFDYRLF